MQCNRNPKSEIDLEAMLREKEAAVQLAVQETEMRLQGEWESKLHQELRNIRLKMEAEKQVFLLFTGKISYTLWQFCTKEIFHLFLWSLCVFLLTWN